MENKICVLTEVSDAQIHLTRTAIYSFLETNKWFDGTIYLAVLPGTSLSQKNISFLESIYLDIQLAPHANNPIIEYFQQFKTPFGQEKTLISAALSSLAFSLPETKVLYFSNTSLFLNDISDLLIPNKISTVPGIDSIFYTGLEDSSELMLSILDRFLELPALTKEKVNSSIFESIRIFPEHRESVDNYYNSIYFTDKRFNQLKTQLNLASYLNFDSVSSNRTDFTKINAIWIQRNNYVFKKYNSPVKADPRLLDALDKNRRLELKRKAALLKTNTFAQDIVLQTIEKASELNYNSGENLIDSNLVLCTICNDLFANGAGVLINTFLENNKWFNQSILVFHSPYYSQLSNQNKENLLKIYDKIIFREIDESRYLEVFERFTKIYKGTPNMRFIPSLFTYEAFELTKEYDKVLYLDSDMVVLDDISEVFNLSEEIIVTPDTSTYNLKSSYSTFNGGFLMLNSSDFTKALSAELIQHSLTSNNYKLFEQSMMNEYLTGKIVSVDSRYNCLKRCFPDFRFFKFPNDIKIIHYVGAKPWDREKKATESRYKQIERLWQIEFSKIKNLFT